MNKKGLTWNVIVSAIIAVIVLILLIWIFKEQIGQVSKEFLNVIKQTTTNSKEFSEGLKNFK